MSGGIGEVAKNVYYATTNPAAYVSNRIREKAVQKLDPKNWNLDDLCFFLVIINTVAIPTLARMRCMQKSRIISIVCVLDSGFIAWAWWTHPFGGIINNFEKLGAEFSVHSETIGIHTNALGTVSVLQKQLLREQCEAAENQIKMQKKAHERVIDALQTRFGNVATRMEAANAQQAFLITLKERKDAAVLNKMKKAVDKQEQQAALDTAAVVDAVKQVIRQEGKDLGDKLDGLLSAIDRAVPPRTFGTCAQEAGKV